MMEISSQVRDIIDVLSEYSGGRLNDPAMFGRFLQHAFDRGTPETVGEFAFQGKYLTRVQSTLRRQTPETELYAKLESEFSRGVHEFHELVSGLVEDGPEEFRNAVQQHHLAVTQDALQHLMQLAEDFSWLKNWELEMTQAGADDESEGGDGTEP